MQAVVVCVRAFTLTVYIRRTRTVTRASDLHCMFSGVHKGDTKVQGDNCPDIGECRLSLEFNQNVEPYENVHSKKIGPVFPPQINLPLTLIAD